MARVVWLGQGLVEDRDTDGHVDLICMPAPGGEVLLQHVEEDNPIPRKAGDKSPDFSLPGSDGQVHKLSEYHWKTVVLAWFPKAFTGG